MNCLLLHFHKYITCLSFDLLWIGQVSSVSFETVCRWVKTNGCFKSGVSLYIPLHEPVFCTIAPVITFVSRVSLQQLVNLIFFVIGEVFHKVPQILSTAQ
jgi:hypothetical protein